MLLKKIVVGSPPSYFLLLYKNTMAKSNLRRTGFILPRSMQSWMKVRAWRQELELETMEGRCLPVCLPCLLFCTTRISCPGVANTCSGLLRPPTSVNHLENALQTCPQCSLMETTPQLRFPVPHDSSCIKQTNTTLYLSPRPLQS